MSKYDWSKVPNWANYCYTTSLGQGQCCNKKPYQDGVNWFIGNNDEYIVDIVLPYNGDWKDSLEERPK